MSQKNNVEKTETHILC